MTNIVAIEMIKYFVSITSFAPMCGFGDRKPQMCNHCPCLSIYISILGQVSEKLGNVEKLWCRFFIAPISDRDFSYFERNPCVNKGATSNIVRKDPKKVTFETPDR